MSKQRVYQQGQEIAFKSLKLPQFTYARLELSTRNRNGPIELDVLTMRTYINLALSQYLGVMSAGFSVDVVNVDAKGCWLRLHREDLGSFIVAVSSWVGITESGHDISWKVQGAARWLNLLIGNQDTQEIWAA